MARGDKGKAKTVRSTGLVFPSNDRRLLYGSLLAGALVVVGALGLYAVGARQTLSPGDVASHHARIDLKCAQCHTSGKGVEPSRCERCHDPSSTGRLEHAAHVWSGSGDLLKGDKAEVLNCAQCHSDHQGRTAVLTKVNDLECASCHGFRSFKNHPEFDAVRGQGTAARGGLEFDHDRHIREAEKASGATCETCHEQTSDHRGFKPMTFDKHCASCHSNNGVLLGETDFVPPTMLVLPADVPSALRGKSLPQIETNPRGRHKATGLRHRDEWVLFNAARLHRGIAPDADAAERASLRQRIAYLEQLQQAPGARLVRRQDREAAITALRTEIAALGAGPQAPAGDESVALSQMTAAAQSILSSLPQPPEPAAGANAGDFEARRGELLRLLDAIDARAGGAARAKVDALRQRVLAVHPGSMTADDTKRALKDRQRRLDHLLVERELDASPRDRIDTPAQDASRDGAHIEPLLATMRARLAALEKTIDMEPASDADVEARTGALESLLTACLKCHRLDETGSRMAPVVSGPVMPHAQFNHAPHILNARCDTCHLRALSSKTSSEALVPPIVSCQKCHKESQVAARCSTCHSYHPQSQLALTMARP
jgi:hypothetical protein